MCLDNVFGPPVVPKESGHSYFCA